MLLFLALTWTAVVARPLHQTATLESILQERAPEFQEATPDSVLQLTSDDLNVGQYLRRYGYMDDVIQHSGYSDENTQRALMAFQRFAGLQVTGEVDEETRQQMLRPRCGMKDIQEERPSDAKWNTTDLSYAIKNYSPDLNKGSIESAFRDAFDQWSGSSKLNFTKIKSGEAIIDMSFVTKYHPPCPYPVDGPGGVLAHAFTPSRHRLGGDIHFDDDETFKYKQGNGFDLASLALHEIGHSLGLDHDPTPGSIMFPWHTGQTTLGPNDIARIKKLYG